MRKVTFGGANSLDNFIARPDGAYDWILMGEEVAEIMKDYWANIDTLVMGRKTWDVGRAAAPKTKKKRTEKKKQEAKNPYGNIKTYVFSRTLKAGEQGGAVIVNDDPGEFVRKLKQQDGKEICVMGGGEIGRELLEAGVIDEIGFAIHPMLLGSGIPLFHEMKRQIDLELIECRPFKNGCVYVLYRVKN
ncbi:MAG: dihydrofolate reductase family protein [Gemmatimonadota bacterium]|nr:dihydrofolate reductase family protein [Gemmatimonadota bacterium]